MLRGISPRHKSWRRAPLRSAAGTVPRPSTYTSPPPPTRGAFGRVIKTVNAYTSRARRKTRVPAADSRRGLRREIDAISSVTPRALLSSRTSCRDGCDVIIGNTSAFRRWGALTFRGDDRPGRDLFRRRPPTRFVTYFFLFVVYLPKQRAETNLECTREKCDRLRGQWRDFSFFNGGKIRVLTGTIEKEKTVCRLGIPDTRPYLITMAYLFSIVTSVTLTDFLCWPSSA